MTAGTNKQFSQSEGSPAPLNSGEPGSEKKSEGGLFTKFRQLFKPDAEEKISSVDFRKETKELTSYNNIVQSEKSKRRVADMEKEPMGEKSEKRVNQETKNNQIDFDVVRSGLINKILPFIRAKKLALSSGGVKSKTPKLSSQNDGFHKSTANKQAQAATAGENPNLSQDKWRAPNIIKTNLIKGDVSTIILDWRRNINLIILSFVMPIFIIGAFYVLLILWKNKVETESEKLGSDIEVLISGIKESEAKAGEIDIFQRKLSLAVKLLDNHVYWTNFFEFLENNLLSNAYITSGLSGGVEGRFQLPIRAKNYQDLADQTRIFKASEFVDEVKVGGGVLQSGKTNDGISDTGINFTVDLQINPKLLYKRQ